MSRTICLATYTLRCTHGGSYSWVFLNWALGLRALGFRVIWLESVVESTPPADLAAATEQLIRNLSPFGLAHDVIVFRRNGSHVELPRCLHRDALGDVELLINPGYDLAPAFIAGFRRSVFVDIDPGLTQTWLHRRELALAAHDLYFSYGETVGQPGSRLPDCGLSWLYTPPPVHIAAWTMPPAVADGSYSSVTNWWGDWMKIDGTLVDNSKRAAFLEYLDLPSRVPASLELALPMNPAEDPTGDLPLLRQHGWRVRHVSEASDTPETYRSYVGNSRGEFSCLKRGYTLLATAWTSERALNYLAAGRPAIVQYTGRSRFLPEGPGLLRFRTPDEAAARVREVENDYVHHAQTAAALAREFFDSRVVITRFLERTLSA